MNVKKKIKIENIVLIFNKSKFENNIIKNGVKKIIDNIIFDFSLLKSFIIWKIIGTIRIKYKNLN